MCIVYAELALSTKYTSCPRPPPPIPRVSSPHHRERPKKTQPSSRIFAVINLPAGIPRFGGAQGRVCIYVCIYIYKFIYTYIYIIVTRVPYSYQYATSEFNPSLSLRLFAAFFYPEPVLERSRSNCKWAQSGIKQKPFQLETIKSEEGARQNVIENKKVSDYSSNRSRATRIVGGRVNVLVSLIRFAGLT